MTDLFPAAVLFDLDGTLIDSAPGVAWSLNQAMAAEGRPQLTVERVKDLLGKGAVHLVGEALDDEDGPDDPDQAARIKDAFLQIYSENPVQDTVMFPCVMDMLESLQARDIPMALCTNKPEITTRPVLKAFDFERFFPVVLCGDMARYKKPDGRHILETAELMNADPARAVMVGDSENDIYAAHEAGVSSVCVTFGYCHEPFDVLNPSVLIDSFENFDAAFSAAMLTGPFVRAK